MLKSVLKRQTTLRGLFCPLDRQPTSQLRTITAGGGKRQRRRKQHRNLQLVRCSSSSADTTSNDPRHIQSVYDTSPNWRDWFAPSEYENPWDRSSPRLLAMDFAPADLATRHLIEHLQNVHHYESVTTVQCNATLHNLLQMMPDDQGNSSRATTTTAPAIANRAVSILENMELFFNNDDHSEHSVMVRQLPKPNRDTYNVVLRILAKTPGTRDIPQLARHIVERMQYKFEHFQILDLQPNSFHWNCVLLSYQLCDDWQRPILALQLVLEKHEELENSSYIHLLLTCIHNDDTRLGASVAIRLYQKLFETTRLNVPSHFYSHFLHAIRSLDVGSPLRNYYYDHCFQRACEFGKLNQPILSEFFIHVKSKEIFDKHLGEYRKLVYGMPAPEAVQTILEVVPESWRDLSDDKQTRR